MKNNIASERTKLGLSQEQLGNLLGVSRDIVSKWELGVTNPKADTVMKLAETFGCSIDYLFCRTEDRITHGPISKN